MGSIAIVIDTNVWIDIDRVFTLFKKKNGNENVSLEAFDTKLFTADEKIKYQGAIDIVGRLLELKDSRKYRTIEIHVPSFVYNEVGYAMSSKITNPSKGNDGDYQKAFEKLLNSMPQKLKLVIGQREMMKEGQDYPQKTKNPKEFESKMSEFLDKQKETNKNLRELYQYLSQHEKQHTDERKKKLKKLISDIRDKYSLWDTPISKILKADNIPYNTRTKQLSTLYNKIMEYPDTKTIPFSSGPKTVISKRLLMNKEEFDFFDLQIYLYAKEKNAYILTLNTQAYQEINDPHFLGYFQGIKIIDPLINFDSLADLENSGDLIDIVKSSIDKDFSNDVTILSNFDKKLNKPMFHEPVERIIKEIKVDYKTSKNLKDVIKKRPLGGMIEILKFEKKELKLSKKLMFSEPSATDTKFAIFELVNREFFKNQISFTDFIIDAEVLPDKYLSKIIQDKILQKRLRDFLTNERTNLQSFIELNKRFNKETGEKNKVKEEIKQCYTALYAESHFKKTDIENQLKPSPTREPKKRHPSRKRAKKREVGKGLLRCEAIGDFDGKGIEQSPQRVKVNNEISFESLGSIKETKQHSQLIPFSDQIIDTSSNNERNINSIMPIESRKSLESLHLPAPLHPYQVYYQNEQQFSNQQRIDSKRNIDMSPKNNHSSVEVNSTLLLLDVLVRKLNDSKYKLPTEDYLLSPQEKVEKKVEALTTKLELDTNDVVGRLEEQHLKLLKNLSDF